MNYVILAAGEGERLAAEGITSAKPLVRVGGETLVGRLIRIFAETKAESVTIIINSAQPAVGDYLTMNVLQEYGLPIYVASARTAGSMHSFARIAQLVEAGKFVMTTVDTVFGEEEFARYVSEFEAMPETIDGRRTGLMGTTKYIDDEKPLYVQSDPNGYITAFCDKACGLQDGCSISAGIYGLQMPSAAELLAGCMEEGHTRMRDYQRYLLNYYKLRSHDMGKVIDIDHAADIAKAEELIK